MNERMRPCGSVYERVVGKKNGCVYGQEFDNNQMVLVAELCVKVIEKKWKEACKVCKKWERKWRIRYYEARRIRYYEYSLLC